MSLPEPFLDNLKFQRDLVDEARLLVARHCPELTNFNLSNPLATLIELQGWGIEMVAYRTNQIPEKFYIRVLNMLGKTLAPPQPAKTEITFYLSAPFPLKPNDLKSDRALIPADTEVGTTRAEEAAEIIFTTDKPREVRAPEIIAVLRGDDPKRLYWTNGAEDVMKAFGDPDAKPGPNSERDATIHEGDAFYIGLNPKTDLRGYVLRLDIHCVRAKGSGIRRNDPPWVWECLCETPEGNVPVPISTGRQPDEVDTTGGLNNEEGQVVLYLPQNAIADSDAGKFKVATMAYWLRCVYRPKTGQQGYLQSPLITKIGVSVIGVSVPATHARVAHDEFLGISTGDPGQTFKLQHGPLLLEDVQQTQPQIEEVPVTHRQDPRKKNKPHVWQCQPDFAFSIEDDRHFVADARAGEVAFGPMVMQRDGSPKQYGRVPAPGSELRITRYRYGGGVAGNVPENTLTELRNSLAYVAYVTNWSAARGGLDEEQLQEALLRLRREMWAQRAVTSDDIEQLALQTQNDAGIRIVSRAKCGQASTPGTVIVRVLPILNVGPDNSIPLDGLNPQRNNPLIKQVQQHLDAHRMLTARIELSSPQFVGIKVTARVQLKTNNGRNAEDIVKNIKWLLRTWLAPLNLMPKQADVYPARLQAGDDSPAALAAIAQEFLSRFIQADAETLNPWSAEAQWQGWPFGRLPTPSEAQELIERVPGVKAAQDVQLFATSLFKDKSIPMVMPLDEWRSKQNDASLSDVLMCSFGPTDGGFDHDIRVDASGGSSP